MNNIKTFKVFMTNENIANFNVVQFDNQLDQLTNKFRALEISLSNYTLDQLKNEYKLIAIMDDNDNLVDELETLSQMFYNFFNDLPENDVDLHQELSDKVYNLNHNVDLFKHSLSDYKKAFDIIGDLDKGSTYFK